MPSARLLAFAFLAAAPLACGSSSSDDSGSGGTSGSGGGFTKLDPAPNIDTETCKAIHESDTDASSHCASCCSGSANASTSSFINGALCTCALPRDSDVSKTVCASATANGDTCSACCSDNGYLISGWVGEDTLTHTQAACACSTLQDKKVCAGSAGSEEACTNCCMHEGFISYGYGSSVGCWCIG